MARPKAPFTVQQKNATAVNVLRSWLNSTGLKVEGTSRGAGRMVVASPAGQRISVQITSSDSQIDPDCIQVQARDILGKRLQRALEAFWSVTDALGEPRREPINRGPEPAQNEKGNPRKLHYRENFFDVVIRHTEFRRSVNPDPEVFARFRVTMERVAWNFLKLNSHLCARNCIEIEDLLQLARCWLVNFCSRYMTSRPTHFDNERKFHRYLQQRFHCDLYPVLLKQQRSTLPDQETVCVALFDRPEIPGQDQVEDVEDESYRTRKCQLDVSTMDKRRNSAAAMLDKLLAGMPHQQMLETLDAATSNPDIEYSARREAGRRLKVHRQKCSTCSVPVAKVNKKAARLNAARRSEQLVNF